jgi:hypothetical protein
MNFIFFTSHVTIHSWEELLIGINRRTNFLSNIGIIFFVNAIQIKKINAIINSDIKLLKSRNNDDKDVTIKPKTKRNLLK